MAIYSPRRRRLHAASYNRMQRALAERRVHLRNLRTALWLPHALAAVMHEAHARSSTPVGCRLKAAACWCRGRRYTAQPIGTAMVTSSHRHAMHAFIVSTVDQHVHVSRRSHDLATQRCTARSIEESTARTSYLFA